MSDASVATAPPFSRSVRALTSRLRAPAVITVARIAGAGLALVVQILLARSIPQALLGHYFTAISLATVIAMVTAMGYPGITVRFVSRYNAKARPRWRQSFLRLARRDTAILALFGMAALLCAIRIMPLHPDLRTALMLTAPLVPAIAFMRIAGARAIAEKRPYLGFLPDTFGRPFLLFAGVLILLSWQNHIGFEAVLLITTISACLMAIVQSLLVVQMSGLRPQSVERCEEDATAETSRRLTKRWRHAGLGLILPTLFAGLLVDLMLAWSSIFLPAAEIAVLAICAKVAFLAGFVSQVLLQTQMPDIANAYFRNNANRLLQRCARTLVLSLALSGLALIFFSLAGSRVLALFGDAYVDGQALLVVFSLMLILRIPGMLAVQLLTVMGRQAAINRGLPFVLFAGLALMAVLSGSHGVLGAAYGATAMIALHSTVFSGLVLRLLRLRRLGVR